MALNITVMLGGFSAEREVSLKTGLTLEASKAALSRLARTGVAEPELRDDGELVYRIRGVHDAPVASSEGRGSSNKE